MGFGWNRHGIRNCAVAQSFFGERAIGLRVRPSNGGRCQPDQRRAEQDLDQNVAERSVGDANELREDDETENPPRAKAE